MPTGCLACAGSVQQWLGQDLAGQVYWIESDAADEQPRVDLASASDRGRADTLQEKSSTARCRRSS